MRVLVCVAAAVAVATAATGSAASLGGLRPGTALAGTGAVAPCDADGVGISYDTAGGDVVAVTISGIDPACAGARARLVLVGASGAKVSEAGPVTVTGGSMQLGSERVVAGLVLGYSVVLDGP